MGLMWFLTCLRCHVEAWEQEQAQRCNPPQRSASSTACCLSPLEPSLHIYNNKEKYSSCWWFPCEGQYLLLIVTLTLTPIFLHKLFYIDIGEFTAHELKWELRTWNMSMFIGHWTAAVMFDSMSWDPCFWHRFKIFLYVPRETWKKAREYKTLPHC